MTPEPARRRAWIEAWWARPDHRDIPFTEKLCEVVEACVEDATRELREIVASAHALRCTCGDDNKPGGTLGDPRCIELQAMAKEGKV